LIAEWSPNPAKAVALAEEAFGSAVTTNSRVLLAAIRVRAAARTGDRRTALAAAAIVADTAMDSEPDDDLGDLGGLLTFLHAKRHYYLGGTFALIGDHSAASTHARTAIDLY
jgi:hypothetical protein